MRDNRQIAAREIKEYRESYDLNHLAARLVGLPDKPIPIIRERLLLAAKLTERSTGRAGPKAYGNSWPPMLREFVDLVAQESGQEGERDRDVNRIMLQPTARQISQAEEALTWRRHVTEAQALAALNIWLRCKALRIRSWQREARTRGFSTSTAKRRLERAFFLIALGISQEGGTLEEPKR